LLKIHQKIPETSNRLATGIFLVVALARHKPPAMPGSKKL